MGATRKTVNTVRGSVGRVVQGGVIKRVFLGDGHRSTRALAAVSVVLAGTIAGLVVLGRPADAPDVPVAAVAAYEAGYACGVGWVDPRDLPPRVPIAEYQHSPDEVLGPGNPLVIAVQGLTGRSVILQSARVEVVERTAAAEGAFLFRECQSEQPVRVFDVDLDHPRPRVVAAAADIKPFPYRVHESDPEQFEIVPDLDVGQVSWRLVLEWTSGADRGTLVVDDNGEPFRTTSLTAAVRYCQPSGADFYRYWQAKC